MQNLSAVDVVRTYSDALTAPVADNKTELKKAAQEFESLFVGYLLKVMRETIQETGGEESGFGRQIYTELFDQELARSMAQHGVLGIAELIEERLSSAKAAPRPESRKPAPEEGVSEIPDYQLPLQAPISSGFGWRRDPFSGERRVHRGVDIAAPEGTEVQAVLGGEVTAAGYERGYGNTVVVRHPNGLQTRYAHLGNIAVHSGQTVDPHQAVGSVGSTGRSTGPHLHFEVTQRGRALDPVEALAE